MTSRLVVTKVIAAVVILSVVESIIEYSYSNGYRIAAQNSVANALSIAKYSLEECILEVENNDLQRAILHCQSASSISTTIKRYGTPSSGWEYAINSRRQITSQGTSNAEARPVAFIIYQVV